MDRKLAAIFSADVKGYSRLMGDDEEATIRTLTVYREVMTALIQQHQGRVVDSPGDNLLAEFASAVDAVQSAVEIQRELRAKNTDLSDTRKMEYRIGINVGDVIVEGERLYGDGVNIAARLEGLAEPGGIRISGTVYDQVENKLTLGYEYVGEQEVKNIAKPVRVYRVRRDDEENQQAEDLANQKAKVKEQKPVLSLVEGTKVENSVGNSYRSWPVVALAGVLLIAATFVTVRYLSFPTSTQPPAPSPQAAPAALPLPDKPSIVVLPFDNMSKDPEQEYFSNGITEVLTSDLSRISSLFVIARNTAFTYKGKATNVQEIGKELGVRYVLEGSVQRAEEQVRIVVQLIDTTTGSHIWSERYDRPLKDIFALQDEIVQKIVTTLKLQLTLQEQGFIVRKTTDHLEAYDSFLRGVEYFWRATKETNLQARQMFEKAVALDPQYAEAYVWLSTTYSLEWIWHWSPDLQNLQRAFEMAQKALALDDSLPGAHSLLSWNYAQKQQYDQAVAEGERAIAFDPNNADSYAWQADVLILAGRPEEALRMAEQAMRLNPRYPPWYLLELGVAYRFTGRYVEAVATLKEVISRSPTNLSAHVNLAVSYGSQWAFQLSQNPQTLAQALAAAQRAVALNDSSPWGHAILGYVYLGQKQYEPAVAELERAIALDPNSAGGYAGLADALSRVGRSEDAVGMAAEQALRRKPFIPDEHLGSVGTAYYLAGRPEEAIAPLKQYLARYPNILGAHLTLAAVYSELGNEAEARVEAAEILRLNPQFSLEVHRKRVPIKDPARLERHIAVLRKAGLK